MLRFYFKNLAISNADDHDIDDEGPVGCNFKNLHHFIFLHKNLKSDHEIHINTVNRNM